ncbi:MAG: RNase H-like domain-containing protein [Bacteroidota bacterium]
MISPLSDSSTISHSIITAYTVCHADARNVIVRLMNTSNTNIELQVGQKIGEFCPLVEAPCQNNYSLDNNNFSCSTRVTPGVSSELEAALSDNLSPSDRQQILSTLLQFSDVFEENLGHTTVLEHQIDTGNAQPIRQYPRRLPFAFREEAKDQVQEMLKQGVIQPSSSPWASPIVLVKKKDGKYRFCIDYRKLNSVTKKDAHPLPRVDDLLDALQGSCMFSTLDLRSGYWQVSVAPEDREKTAFVTPDGLWEFCRLPFGVSNGCATFQRAIEIVLSGLTYDTCLCYFDDVIIPSSNLQEHCARLATVLSRFRLHNLRVKASKCSFGASKVLFLGHIVSAQGVHTDPKKIESVSSLCPPNSVDQVRSFLGLAGYYRKFIPNFASLSAPLVALTKKGSKFLWSTEHAASFQTLKQLLCDAPILAYPDFRQPFVLQTDASDHGLGAVLTQVDSAGCEHVIAYASRSLSDRERRFSATEKETLAMVFGTDHFRAYLLGRPFTLVTDHSALRWLHSVEPKGRLGRWLMDLQEYSFQVQHRPGSANGNADALSRLPSENSSPAPDLQPEAVDNPSLGCATTLNPGYNLQQAQMEDPHLSKIIEMKLADLPKPPQFVWGKDPVFHAFWQCWDLLHVVNGLLVKSNAGESAFPQYAFVVPHSLIQSVLQGIHCSPFSGHLGIRRTILRTKNRFYWPKMMSQIKTYVKECHVCAQNKPGSQNNSAPLHPIEINEPFVFWAMDYMGPLPETARGNKHLLVVMDHFTKWCEVFPTTDQRAQTVARVLVSRVFSRFGPPQVIHSDQGRNFESHLMQEVCQLMGIHKSRTTAYHPQCDGLVERQNRTLQTILSAYVSAHQDDWDTWVSLAVYAYNTSTHESTGVSPYELVFGRPARTPLEVDLDIPLKNPCSQSEYTQALRKSLHSLQQVARGNLATSRARQSNSHSSTDRNWTPLPVGSSVWLRRPKSWKFGGRWIGPFEIIKQTGVNYTIRSKLGKDSVVHHNNVKPCVVPSGQGEPFCPTQESWDAVIYPGGPEPNVGGDQQRERPVCAPRPAHLRQDVRPPLRFGDFVTH